MLTQEEGAGGLTLTDTLHLGAVRRDTSATDSAKTLIAPLLKSGPIKSPTVTPLDMANVLGFPLRSLSHQRSLPLPPLEWRIPPSSFVLVSLTEASAPFEGIYDLMCADDLAPGGPTCRWYRMRVPSACWYDVPRDPACPWWAAVCNGVRHIQKDGMTITALPSQYWRIGHLEPFVDVTLSSASKVHRIQLYTYTRDLVFPWIWTAGTDIPHTPAHTVATRDLARRPAFPHWREWLGGFRGTGRPEASAAPDRNLDAAAARRMVYLEPEPFRPPAGTRGRRCARPA